MITQYFCFQNQADRNGHGKGVKDCSDRPLLINMSFFKAGDFDFDFNFNFDLDFDFQFQSRFLILTSISSLSSISSSTMIQF